MAEKGVSDIKQFARVGTTLYKMVRQPSINGEFIERRVVWNVETFRQDYGNDKLSEIPKYDGFCTVPNHINYQSVIDKFLNLYEPIGHTPMPGECPLVLSLFKHIFGKQYELGLDYVQLLYTQPVQKLPILLLTSQERNTGKSTFLNFLKALFQGNVTFNTNEDFRSQFNSDWAGKLIIAVDEVLLDRREDSERLKNLSTALSYKIEAKGKDHYEVAFFAKFILSSNNEHLPVIIDSGEIRYWVRQVPALQTDDPNILPKLKAEIPHFLHFLLHRKLSTEQYGRMWFSPQQIRTAALQRIIRSNRCRMEVELTDILLDIMDSMGVDSVSFIPKDLIFLLEYARVRVDTIQIRKVLQEIWKLKPASNSLTYARYEGNYNAPERYSESKGIGRYYTVTREMLTHSDELMND